MKYVLFRLAGSLAPPVAVNLTHYPEDMAGPPSPGRIGSGFKPNKLNSEVAAGGGVDQALSECARPRAQQLPSFKPWNISQPSAHPTWLRPGRPHSANAEIQLRSSGSNRSSAFTRSRRGISGWPRAGRARFLWQSPSRPARTASENTASNASSTSSGNRG